MPPLDLDRLSQAELKVLVASLLGEIAALKETVAAQRDEIARLKGLTGRPALKPSGMEVATGPTPPNTKRRRGPVRPRLVIHEDRVVPAVVPTQARFKGYKDFLVQDLLVAPHVIRYRRERWRLPDGRCLTAPPPSGIDGHFGANLRRFVLMLYHQGQTTVPRLARLLRDLGLIISKRQVLRILNEQSSGFVAEAAAVLKAGINSAGWLAVDDTGARHAGRNGFCTRIGNDRFTAFATRPGKSRQSFLALLCGAAPAYVINKAARDHLRAARLPYTQWRALARHPDKRFGDAASWQAHLEALGITGLRQTPDPVALATEAALYHGLAPDARSGRACHGSRSLGLCGRAGAWPDLGSLCPAQGVARQSRPGGTGRMRGRLRPHLRADDRPSRAGAGAGAAPSAQGRAPGGAGIS